MAIEIHAALVGGALAGLVVLLGVGLTEVLHRARDRRYTVEGTTQELVVRLPHVLMGVSDRRPDGFDTSYQSHWWQEREACFRLLNELRTAARGWRAREIRRAANELSAKVTAAELQASRGVLLTWEEAANITSHGLFGLVFRTAENLDALVREELGMKA